MEITPQLPFGWYLLWFSSLCYTAALFISVIRCPEFIKKYPNFGVYSSFGHSPRWLVWSIYEVAREGGGAWRKLAGRLIEKGFAIESKSAPQGGGEPVVGRSETSYFFTHEQREYVVAMPPKAACCSNPALVSDVEREVFWEVFGAKSGGRSLSRLIILVLLSLSAVLFLVTLLQHICAAVPEAIRGFSGDALLLFDVVYGVIVSFITSG